MKFIFNFFTLILFLVAVFLTSITHAATEEWNFDCGSNMVYQVYADGKGGAALVYAYTFTNATLVWLDKKGQTIFQTGLSNLALMGIVGCTPKDLVYCDEYSGVGQQIFHVDSKGQKDTLAADPNSFNSSFNLIPSYRNESKDKKGFFVSFTDTNNYNSLFVRYKNK